MLYALILAGGKGTRLYPLSREDNPKQFLKIAGNKSFLRNTVDRIAKLVPKENIFIVTNDSYKEKIIKELEDISAENIFTEPANKETATCIGLSAIKLLKKDQDATMIVLPSDHHIEMEDKYIKTLKEGVDLAKKRRGLVTIGVTPSRAETGYGYIEVGKGLNSSIAGYKVERFVEKPNVEVAQDFLSKGNYLWNSGMFIWKADTFCRELERYLPKMHKHLMEIYKHLGTELEDEVIKEQYSLIDGISVDFGIMQKTRKAYVVKCDFKWDDIGNFNSLGRFLKKEENNRVRGNAFLEQSENCSIFGDKKLIIGFGLKDLVVVDAGEIMLIMNKNKDQEIKQLATKIQNHKEYNKFS